MEEIKSVGKRLLKGLIAGSIASMAMITLQTPSVWTDFVPLLNSLAVAGMFGAITGLLLALQKWASWTE
jgi:uncharacterized membrane protein